VDGYCENNNEYLGSIKCREFLDQLRNYKLLKDSTAWSLFLSYLVAKNNFTLRKYVLNYLSEKLTTVSGQ
jgi:hypothetical protein